MIDLLNTKLNRINWIVLLKQGKIQDGIFMYMQYINSLEDLLNDENCEETDTPLIFEEINNAKKIYMAMLLALGDKYYQHHDYENAAMCYTELNKMVKLKDDWLMKYASCLEELKQYDLQIELIETMKKNSKLEETAFYNDISEKYDKNGDIQNAIKYREKSLESKNKVSASEYNNLGDLYNRYYSNHTEKVELALKSLQYFKKASDLHTTERIFAKNATIMAGKTNCVEDSKFYWKRMLKINEMTNDDKFDYACFCLKQGNIDGWYKYSDARFQKENNRTYLPEIKKPYWDGKTDISNSTLLVHYEQGFGDSILFAGYLNRLKPFAKNLIYVVQDELKELMERNFPDIKVLGKSDANLANLNFSYYVPAMSIPKVLNIPINEIGVGKNYLLANSDLTAKFKDKYFNNDKIKIGISFAGNNVGNKTRDIPIEEFLPFDKLENTELYSFTKGLSDNAFKKFTNNKVNNIANDFNNFDDTAAAMTNCDYIVTSDNVLLNLAGALGKKTFGLYNWSYEFRWFDLKGDNVVWFDTVKPFVNENMNVWEPSIEKVITEISQNH